MSTAIDQPEVGTAEWHEQRRERLGASEVPAILGLSPWKSAYQVWLEKTGRVPPWGGSEATRTGQRLERAVLDQAEADLGTLARDVLRVAEGVNCPLAATLDGMVIEDGIPVEAKTSGIVGPVYGEWGEEGSDVIPQAYLVQVAVQMLCSEAELAHVYALLGGRGIIRYRVMRDEEVIKTIADRCCRWWEKHIERGIEPKLSEPLPLEIVKRLRREPNKTIALAEDALAKVLAWEEAKAAKSAAEKAAEAAQSELLMLLGDAEAATLPDSRVIEYREQSRKGYSVADSSYRVLRVKGKPQ